MDSINETFEAMMQSGWDVLVSDFDSAAFTRWRTKARDCLSALALPEPIDTQSFDN